MTGTHIIAVGILTLNLISPQEPQEVFQNPVTTIITSAQQVNKEPEEEKPAFALTNAERDLIERVVASEARGEPFNGQVAVAQVIKDRAECWNMTVSQVLYSPSQFAAPYRGKVSESIKQAVSAVFDEGCSEFESRVTHFHASYVSPSWARRKNFVGRIGAHLFYV